ncbi:tyrosine-type recombinase/integrase [Methylobacterium terricola]|nr:tyrosine-type recombinase/integrase [Methylobacterium terricola]
MSEKTTKSAKPRSKARDGKRKKLPPNLVQPENSANLHYEFMIGGERFRGTTGTAVVRDAAKFVRELKEAERVRIRSAGDQPRKEVSGGTKPRTLLQAMELLMETRPLTGEPKKNRDRKADVICRLLGPDMPIVRIDDALVGDLWGKLRRTHVRDDPKKPLLSNAYINAHIEVLHMALKAAKRVKVVLPDEPDWTVYTLQEKPRRRELTAEEQIRIEEHLRPDIRPAMRFLIETALRRTDGVELRWSQVDWIDGIIRLTVKGDKTAELPITEEIGAILFEQYEARQDEAQEAVFTFVAEQTRYLARSKVRRFYERGKRYPLTGWYFYQLFSNACKAAGVADARPHDLRKTTGSQTLRATGNIVAVQQRLHHANIKTTREAYAHVTTEDTARAMSTTSAFMAWKRELALEARRQRAAGDLRIGLLGSAAAWGFSRNRRGCPPSEIPEIPRSEGTWPSQSSTPPLSGSEHPTAPDIPAITKASSCNEKGKSISQELWHEMLPVWQILREERNRTLPDGNSRSFPAAEVAAFIRAKLDADQLDRDVAELPELGSDPSRPRGPMEWAYDPATDWAAHLSVEGS